MGTDFRFHSTSNLPEEILKVDLGLNHIGATAGLDARGSDERDMDGLFRAEGSPPGRNLVKQVAAVVLGNGERLFGVLHFAKVDNAIRPVDDKVVTFQR